jgi:hypothetical protein
MDESERVKPGVYHAGRATIVQDRATGTRLAYDVIHAQDNILLEAAKEIVSDALENRSGKVLKATLKVAKSLADLHYTLTPKA